MFADPAQTGAYGPGLVHHRRAVYANFPFDLSFSLSNPFEQRFQLVAQNIVIIVPPGVTRNLADICLTNIWLADIWRVHTLIGALIGSEIIERDRDHRFRRRQQRARVSAPLR